MTGDERKDEALGVDRDVPGASRPQRTQRRARPALASYKRADWTEGAGGFEAGGFGAGGFGAGGPCSVWRRGEGSTTSRRGAWASWGLGVAGQEVEWRRHYHLLCEHRPRLCGLQQAQVGTQGRATWEPCACSTSHVLLAPAVRRAPLGPAVRVLPVPGAGSLRSRRGQVASSRPRGSMGSGPPPSSRWWPATPGFPKRHPTCLPVFRLLPLTG